jgi:hypothetical protein
MGGSAGNGEGIAGALASWSESADGNNAMPREAIDQGFEHPEKATLISANTHPSFNENPTVLRY